MTDHWFRQKRYGLGATPSNWKGWAFLTGYVVLLIGAMWWVTANTHNPQAHPLAALSVSAAMTIVFVYVCWRKTEGGWRWRWGGNDRR